MITTNAKEVHTEVAGRNVLQAVETLVANISKQVD